MLSHNQHQARSRKRAKWAIETDATKIVLQSVARMDIFEHYCWTEDDGTYDRWIRMQDIFQHDDFAYYPIKLEFQNRKLRRREVGLKGLVPEIASTFLGQSLQELELTGEFDEGSRGVVISWHEELAVIHNQPHLCSKGPLDQIEYPSGHYLALHWFEPFVAEVADCCRCDMAEEQAIIDLEEGDWGLKDWSDYPTPDFV